MHFTYRWDTIDYRLWHSLRITSPPADTTSSKRLEKGWGRGCWEMNGWSGNHDTEATCLGQAARQVRYVSFVDSSSIVFINGRRFLLIHQMLLVKVGPATLGQTSVSRATLVGKRQQPERTKISFSTPGIVLAGIRKLSPSDHALTQPTLHPGHLCFMTNTRPTLFANPPAPAEHLLEVMRQNPHQSRIPTHPLNHPLTS